jgi:transcriptional regulator with XRE-family HTH domain
MIGKVLGDIIRKRRIDLGVRQDDLSEATKISQGYISAIEAGKIDNPSEDKIKEIEKALNMKSGELIQIIKPGSKSRDIYIQELTTLCAGLSIRSIKTIIGLAEDLRDSEAEQSKAKIG